MNTVIAMLTDGSSELSQLRSWLALLHAGALADYNLQELLEHFVTAEAVLGAVRGRVDQSFSFTQKVLECLRKPDWQEIDRELRYLEHPHHHLIPLDSPRYPALLKQIPAAAAGFVRTWRPGGPDRPTDCYCR